MRILLAIILLTGLTTISVRAQQFRIATWQVADVPMPKQTNATPMAEPARIAEIAATLSLADADAVILYGIIDVQALKRIAESMKPKRYSVAIHSVFRQNSSSRSPVVGQPFGILTKREKMSAKNIEWNDTGRIDMPGGFTFSTLRHGNGAVCIYVANFPGSLTNGVSSVDGSYFSRKRNYAAEYLAHHSSWVATTYTNQSFATYLTADINLVSKKPVKDDCTSLLEKSGFRPVPVGVTQDKSSMAVTNGPLVSRIFDPVFTRNVEFMATRQVPAPAPEQPLVICEITLKSGGSASVTKPVLKSAPRQESIEEPAPIAPVPAPAPVQIVATPAAAPIVKTASPAALSVPAPVKEEPASASAAVTASASEHVSAEPWFWPVVGGGVLSVLAVLVLNTRSSKRRNDSSAVSRPMFVEMNSSSRSSRTMMESAGNAVLSEPTTATDNAHNGVWQSPSVRLGAPESGSAKEARAGLMPHLRQLMREKLFLWLSNQRSQLLDSHENGTAKVLGLEERLGKIKDQFQDRLIAQEQRIAEMDRELREKEKLLNESRPPKSQSGESPKFS